MVKSDVADVLIPGTSRLVNPDPLPVMIPVKTTPFGFACAFTLPPASLRAVASIPVKLEPSP